MSASEKGGGPSALSVWAERLNLAALALRRTAMNHMGNGLYYVVEGQDWVIRREGEGILQELAGQEPGLRAELVTSARWLKGQVVHFGSLGCLATGLAYCHPSNRVAATVYHGYEGMDSGMQARLETLLKGLDKIDIVLTACSIMQKRLTGWGVPPDKLKVIPLGASTSRFRPKGKAERARLRAELGIPEDAVCIGSFQKDGNGWGEGLEPKLIKGPDIFVEVMGRLKRRFPVFALLTGPARGYVKAGLDKAGVPYCHRFVQDFNRLPDYYNCLDLYLMTSREEGGPKCLPESMASGAPLVSTRVGMAEDMITSGENGFLTDVEDVDALAGFCEQLIVDADLRRVVTEKALETVNSYDLPFLAREHYRRVYSPLLESL